jgi:hypothetical protein
LFNLDSNDLLIYLNKYQFQDVILYMDLSPIVLFVYNRYDHTLKTLEALSRNVLADQSKLYVFSDGPKQGSTADDKLKIQRVRDLIHLKQWCKEVIVIEHKTNVGFSNNIITGITQVLDQFERVIVIEDDIVIGPAFLQYMNTALELYQHENKVMHINGFNFPINFNLKEETFFLKGITCPWGWATWRRAWRFLEIDKEALVKEIGRSEKNMYTFNFNGHVDHFSLIDKSWDIQWYASVFSKSGYSLWPARSLVNNIGHDGTGVHCPPSDIYENKDVVDGVKLRYLEVKEDLGAYQKILAFYKKVNKSSLFDRSKEIIKRVLTNVYGGF